MKPDPQADRNPEITDLLLKTKALLAGPQKLGENLAKVEEAHSFTASGIGCEAWDATAARWTLVGALAKFSMAPPPWSAGVPAPLVGIRSEVLFDGAFRYLFAAAIIQAPQTVNGVNNRGWDAVRDLIDFAILLAEHGAVIRPDVILPPGVHPSPELRKCFEEISGVKVANVQVPS